MTLDNLEEREVFPVSFFQAHIITLMGYNLIRLHGGNFSILSEELHGQTYCRNDGPNFNQGWPA